MMLGQDELKQAIIEGQKAAEVCGTFCRLGATLEDGRYLCHHNGVGARDTDQQIVHANPTLTMNTEQLAAHLAAWLKGLHGHGERRDLNATLATGGPVTAGMDYVVGERGPELFRPEYDLRAAVKAAVEALAGFEEAVERAAARLGALT